MLSHRDISLSPHYAEQRTGGFDCEALLAHSAEHGDAHELVCSLRPYTQDTVTHI